MQFYLQHLSFVCGAHRICQTTSTVNIDSHNFFQDPPFQYIDKVYRLLQSLTYVFLTNKSSSFFHLYFAQCPHTPYDVLTNWAIWWDQLVFCPFSHTFLECCRRILSIWFLLSQLLHPVRNNNRTLIYVTYAIMCNSTTVI